MNSIRVLDVIRWTTVDGPGFRTAIYCAGCRFHCKECHNPESWSFSAGQSVKVDDLLEILQQDDTAITFSGGDPLFQVEAFTELAKKIKEQTQKNIWCYTGHCYEDITKSEKLSRILPFIDVLVDGTFHYDQKDESLCFRGSRNQRLIDVQQSLRENKVVIVKQEDLCS
jgi:anaerobic ribonucleoside-triphosphate reductase activating protein